jgi:hypothetical protein
MKLSVIDSFSAKSSHSRDKKNPAEAGQIDPEFVRHRVM